MKNKRRRAAPRGPNWMTAGRRAEQRRPSSQNSSVRLAATMTESWRSPIQAMQMLLHPGRGKVGRGSVQTIRAPWIMTLVPTRTQEPEPQPGPVNFCGTIYMRSTRTIFPNMKPCCQNIENTWAPRRSSTRSLRVIHSEAVTETSAKSARLKAIFLTKDLLFFVKAVLMPITRLA
jgi:hypothetical protein